MSIFIGWHITQCHIVYVEDAIEIARAGKLEVADKAVTVEIAGTVEAVCE